VDTLPYLGGIDISNLGRQPDVGLDRKPGKEIMSLKDNADLWRRVSLPAAKNFYNSRICINQRRYDAEQRTLAATTWANQGDELAPLHLEGRILQRLHAAERLGHIRDAYTCFNPESRRRTDRRIGARFHFFAPTHPLWEMSKMTPFGSRNFIS